MTITTLLPEKTYPYIAVYYLCSASGNLSNEELKKIDKNELVLISIVHKQDSDSLVYVQYLFGGKEGYVTKREKDYLPLPKGFQITITQ